MFPAIPRCTHKTASNLPSTSPVQRPPFQLYSTTLLGIEKEDFAFPIPIPGGPP